MISQYNYMVRLGDGEHVALAQEGEALGELRPLCGARYLLAEDAFGASRLEVAFLRCQPGGLVDGGCPCVPDNHGPAPPLCPFCLEDIIGRLVR
jgi:hypothetical protein